MCPDLHIACGNSEQDILKATRANIRDTSQHNSYLQLALSAKWEKKASHWFKMC